MKLTQTLSIALCVVGALTFSSCSKEDVQTPQPQAGNVNEHSGAKTDAGEQAFLPEFPNTIASEVNWNLFPKDWQREAMLPANITGLPAGSSTLTSLWGHQMGWSVTTDPHWVKPLPPISNNQIANSMVTITTFAKELDELAGKGGASTMLRNLKVGKTYTLTFYLATTTVSDMGVGSESACAKMAEVKIYNMDGTHTSTHYPFNGKEGEWLKKTITFKAKADKAKFYFSGLAPLGDKYSYIHMFVDNNSIKELIAFQPMVTQ
jgi:hypothetical protein